MTATAALPPALTATAGALLCWPRATSTARLRALTPDPTTRPRNGGRYRPSPPVLIGVPALLALCTFGIGPAIAAAVGGATARGQWRARNEARARLTSAEAMADALHGLVAELRAGAHPVAAAEAAAHDPKPPADAVLTQIAATARLGGDLTSIPHRYTTDNPALVPVLRPLVNAWTLAQRHGLPLADVLDAVRADVVGRIRFAHKVRARMAGPRASGAVLAALPALGVLLGEAMGAHPLHILFANSLGQALLAAGTILICLGLRWINRLTSQAALP
ncbi:MAG TPA: type II secretion system F family protein [Pseudonocardiaceae bacterium]